MGKRIQKIMLREIGKEILNLGYAGENEHTEITINCAEVYTDYPDATVQMVVKPPAGDQYLAVVTYTAGLLKWDILASDVAASGSGSYQLIFEDGGVEIFRSAIGKTQIMASLDGSTGDAPTPQETWAEAMASVLEEQIAEIAGDTVDAKADKTDTVLLTTLSRGRKEGTTVGVRSFAFGNDVTASGQDSHAEGLTTKATGYNSHAEGYSTEAGGGSAHAEGTGSKATAHVSHAEGYSTEAKGTNSHSEGTMTIANHKAQHVFGEYNTPDNSTNASSERGNYVEIVGNGQSNLRTSNARTLDWSGNESLAGGLTLGKGTTDETTITAVQLKALLALLQ